MRCAGVHFTCSWTGSSTPTDRIINETVDDVEQEPADDEPDVAYYLVIKNSDGEVIDRIPVAPDEEVSIVPANNSTATNSTAGS